MVFSTCPCQLAFCFIISVYCSTVDLVILLLVEMSKVSGFGPFAVVLLCMSLSRPPRSGIDGQWWRCSPTVSSSCLLVGPRRPAACRVLAVPFPLLHVVFLRFGFFHFCQQHFVVFSDGFARLLKVYSLVFSYFLTPL